MQPINKPKRPAGVTILAVFIFLAAAWNGLRLGEAISFWRTLVEYGAHPLYIALSGGIWLLAGLIIVWALWVGESWGRCVTLGVAAGYSLWYWFDRLAIQQPHANWPFALITTIFLLSLISMILFSTNTIRFFNRKLVNEHGSEN